ncbi:MAG TPA: hypothetical protein VHZ95_17190, partial [Polyangiales bacterium]|nr:hypothetical protein [Polyangiales bacterium]
MRRAHPYCLIALLAWASPVRASPLFELTGGLGDQGGFGARETGASAASAYFNPALLTKAEAGLSTGFFVLDERIAIALEGRPSGDVPLSYRGATHADGSVFADPSIPTQWLRQGCQSPECPRALPARPRQSEGSGDNTTTYESIGLVVPIVPHKLVFGFYGLIPLSQFTTAHSFFSDEREQYFTNSLHPELYSDRLTATSLAFGLGAQITDRLSIGVDVTLSLRNTAAADTFVGNADQIDRSLSLSTDVGVKVAFAPHFGVAYDVTRRIHLAATLHTIESFDIVSGISTFLPNGDKQTASRTAVHDYMPVRIGFGASADLISDGKDEP